MDVTVAENKTKPFDAVIYPLADGETLKLEMGEDITPHLEMTWHLTVTRDGTMYKVVSELFQPMTINRSGLKIIYHILTRTSTRVTLLNS